MITVGAKVCVTEFADFILHEGIVKKIKDGKAVIKFPGKSGEYIYNLDNLEEVKTSALQKKAKK